MVVFHKRNIHRSDRFSKMMFPRRKIEDKPVPPEKNAVPDMNIDYFLLMESVDTLMTLYEKMKPLLLSKIHPKKDMK